MEKEWMYKIKPDDLRKYKPEEVIVGVDRVLGEYITFDKIYGVWHPNLKENEQNSSD